MNIFRTSNDLNLYKVTVALVCIIIGFVSLITHHQLTLFPYLQIGFYFSAIILTVVFMKIDSVRLFLPVVVALSLLYRMYTLLFPSSLVGVDADALAYHVMTLIQGGRIESMDTSYTQIPFFHLASGIFSQISGFSPSGGLIIFSILSGLTFPLIAYIFAEKLTDSKTELVGFISAVLAGFSAISMRFGFWFSAQTLGVIFWAFVIYALIRYSETKYKKDLVLLIALIIGGLFTHKLPMPAVFALIFSFSLLRAFNTIVSMESIGEVLQRRNANYGFIFSLLIIATVLLFLYLIYISNYIGPIVFKITSLLLTDTIQLSPSPQVPTEQAKIALSGIKGILMRRGHGLILLPISGLSWLYVFYKERESYSGSIILAASAASVFFVGMGVVNPETAQPSRLMNLAEPVVVVLVGYTLIKFFSDKTNKSVTLVVISVILFAQFFSVAVAVDYPNVNRQYLHSQESAAKNFGYERVPNAVYTDQFYAYTTTSSNLTVGSGVNISKYYRISSGLTNGTLLSKNYRHILYRTDVEVFRFEYGRYKLTWNPQRLLETEYSKIYTNKKINLYNR